MVNLSILFTSGRKISRISPTVINGIENAEKEAEKVLKTIVNTDGSLSRTLANGNKVIISQKNGTTARKVYNQYGQLLLDDTKKLSTEQVGNKTIRTKEVKRSVERINYGNTDYNHGHEFYYKADRVYKDGNLVGMRETEKAPVEYWSHGGEKIYPCYELKENPRTYVTKTYADSNKKVFNFNTQKKIDIPNGENGYVKYFEGTGKDKRIVDKRNIENTNVFTTQRDLGVGGYKPVVNMGIGNMKKTGGYPASTGEMLDSAWGMTRYNAKGLPMPMYTGQNGIYGKYSQADLNAMSLKEMRQLAEKYHQVHYTEFPLGLSHLDKPYN